jgi:hypothetical protein
MTASILSEGQKSQAGLRINRASVLFARAAALVLGGGGCGGHIKGEA